MKVILFFFGSEVKADGKAGGWRLKRVFNVNSFSSRFKLSTS